MSSPLFLSLSTVFALIGIVLVAIAFSTNDWQKYKVDRALIKTAREADPSLQEQIAFLGGFNSADLFFDRTYGLFLECFGIELPNGNPGSIYTSPLGSACMSRSADYQVPENETEISRYSPQEKTRMHLLRLMVAFYIVGLFFLCLCLFTGVSGCWRRSDSLILTTGALLLFAALFLTASMAVWHGVDYLSRTVIMQKPFWKSWPQVLQEATEVSYGWSYMIAWIGIGFILISSVLMLAAYRTMKSEEEMEDGRKLMPYMAPSGGYMTDSKQQALMPFGYGAAYGSYPSGAAAYYGTYATGNYAPYGYLTYGR